MNHAVVSTSGFPFLTLTLVLIFSLILIFTNCLAFPSCRYPWAGERCSELSVSYWFYIFQVMTGCLLSYYYIIECLQALPHSYEAILFDESMKGISFEVFLNYEPNDFSSNLFFCLSVGVHSSEQQCIYDTRSAAVRTYRAVHASSHADISISCVIGLPSL